MKNFIIIIIALTASFASFAQTATTATASSTTFAADLAEQGAVGAFGEKLMADVVETNTTNNTNELVKGFKRIAKPLAENFTGITVQITTSDRQLNENDKLYTQFGGVKVMEMLNPKYCYFIGEFNTEAGAQQYIDQIIGNRYPNAKVVTFKDGKMK